MKAVRLVHLGQPLEEQEIPVPKIGPTDVLIQVQAAGVCHSDVHYREGLSPVAALPLTLGHEVAGLIMAVGHDVTEFSRGDRVCVHYLATCGTCGYCACGTEQFCTTGEMVGKHRDGGYAEYIAVPARSVFHLPDAISFAHGAVMMCSSATAFHALKKARLQSGETVAIFGVGGLGLSAVQLALAEGAQRVFAVDIQPAPLALAEQFGAIPVLAQTNDPVAAIRSQTEGRGVDVALELIGLPQTIRQSLRVLAPQGRAAVAGITNQGVEVFSYQELIAQEAELIGVSDHLAREIPTLLAHAETGALHLDPIITCTIPLAAAAINAALDELAAFGTLGRTVIVP